MASPDSVHGKTESLIKAVEQHVDTEKLKAKLDVSHFDPNAVLRGMQLTLVGGMCPTE